MKGPAFVPVLVPSVLLCLEDNLNAPKSSDRKFVCWQNVDSAQCPTSRILYPRVTCMRAQRIEHRFNPPLACNQNLIISLESNILSHILYRNTPLRLSSCLQRKACHAFNIARKFTLFLEPIDLLEKVLRCFLLHFIDCMDINGGSWSRSYTVRLDSLMITDARGALRPAVSSSRDMSR